MKTISKGIGLSSLIVIGLMFAGLSYSQIALNDVVSRWDFDQGDGTKDSVGGHDGELTGDPKLVDGKFKKAMSFDGKSFMQVDPEPFKFNEPQNFSVSVWVKVNVRSGWQRIYNCWRWGGYFLGELAGNCGLELRMERNVPNCDVNPAGCLLIPVEDVPLGDWIHVAFSVDWNDKVRLYANGEEKASSKIDGPFKYWSRLHDENTTVDTLGIGARIDNGPTEFFNGDIDQLVVFSVALTSDEIETVFKSGLGDVLTVSPKGKLATTWSTLKAK